MNDADIERIAESVFQKLLAKQEEWDKHYYYGSDREALVKKIKALEIIKDQYVLDEKFNLAADVQSKLKVLIDELNKDS